MSSKTKFLLIVYITLLVISYGGSRGGLALGQQKGSLREPPKPLEAPGPGGRLKRRAFPLSMETIPSADCKILVTPQGGKQLEPRQMSFKLFAGAYALVVKCQGFKEYVTDLNLPRDFPTGPRRGLLQISLIRPETKVAITIETVPSEAEVFIGDNSKGHSRADGFLQLPPLESGEYKLRVQKDGYRSETAQLKIPNDKKTIRIELKVDLEIKYYQPLQKAIAEERLQDAFDLLDRLSKADSDSLRVRLAFTEILNALNKRASKILERIGPRGLEIGPKEIADLRRLYQLARTLLPNDVPETERATTLLFAAYWEMKRLADEIRADTLTPGTGQKRQELLSQLALIEASARNNAYLWFDLGWNYQAPLEDLDKARHAFVAARDAAPTWEYPDFALGFMRMNEAYPIKNQRRSRDVLLEAGRAFTEAIRKNPRFFQAYVMLSLCYADAQKQDKYKHYEAINIANQALEISRESGRGNALAKYAVGYAFYAAGEDAKKPHPYLESALPFLQEAIYADHERLEPSLQVRAIELVDQIRRRLNKKSAGAK
jgi:hypothetical protein